MSGVVPVSCSLLSPCCTVSALTHPPSPAIVSLALLGAAAGAVVTALQARLGQTPLALAVLGHYVPTRFASSDDLDGWQVRFSAGTPMDQAQDLASSTPSRLSNSQAILLCTPAADPATQAISQQLRNRHLPHSSLHGNAATQARQCLQLARHLARQQGWHWPELAELQAPRSRWQGLCEKCSDPDCEHRLFSGLMQPGSRSKI